MGKTNEERRLRALLRRADARTKGSLLANNFVETALGGNPILTETDVQEMYRGLKTDDERHACAEMVEGLNGLSTYAWLAACKTDDITLQLTCLAAGFKLAREYRGFEDFLNALCVNTKGGFNEGLLRKVLSLGRERGYDAALREDDLGLSGLSWRVAASEVTDMVEGIERVERQVSELKALIHIIRDLMKRYSGPVNSLEDLCRGSEEGMSRAIHLTKCFLYNIDSDGWDKVKKFLSEADPLVSVMESLAEYEDIAFDEAQCDEIRGAVSETANARGPLLDRVMRGTDD